MSCKANILRISVVHNVIKLFVQIFILGAYFLTIIMIEKQFNNLQEKMWFLFEKKNSFESHQG